MKCPKCGHENREDRKFCSECASPLGIKCPVCNTINQPGEKFCGECAAQLVNKIQSFQAQSEPPSVTTSTPTSSPVPTSFANGRYQVKKFLGEGGKKKVYLAHDTVLDRDVAFALIKTEKLDDAGRTRVKREAQAMARLDHPNIVSVLDFGDHEGQPFMVLPLLSGGDVEGLIKKATDHKLPIDQAVGIAKAVASGLVFAHSRSIIHRDIKPGNVWLSVDGTAKIGDFGLAVALDLSRLTQHGMMVGTVSYMPPEQAMGGEVTAKADLYSLGALLYEMVTGRPPFVGDDSVAIIGQHINTPPVSPTWHRADLPPALETLIMQLLEKDPKKRPESANLVLQALDSIEAGKLKKESAKEPAKESAGATENPLYRRVFVGREREQKQLQSAFDGAVSGQGALMMVMGEPGIGKTSLCEQLATYVTLRGGRTLVGHCYEEGSLSLPYLAFVEAMRSYVLSRDDKKLREELGSGATDIARIVSEIREKLDIKPRAGENPEEDKYRLLQAVTGFLTHVSAVKPILLILEDLHDADKGTLEMLTYVSRNLAGARLLIVGTYRDIEVDRTHPLSAALAELRRVSTFGRVLLRGLNADEVWRMLESITRESVPWSLAEAVHRQTEGNPLFVQEVIRYLTEEKLLVRSGGKMEAASDTPLEMAIPEGLRDVIGKRLSHLSEKCNRLLSVAAVIGRDFRLDILQKVSGLVEDEVFASLEEARKLAVIEERRGVGAAVTYRFAHAFFRTTLYEEIIAPRRIRLHQQVARALEAVHAQRLQEHAAELAEHFSYSTDASDLSKAVSYGEMAAQRATEVYNYGEAARLLQQALKVQEVLDPNDKGKRCDLLLTLGYAHMVSGQYRRALDTEYPEALSLAEQMGDNDRAAKACSYAAWALSFGGAQAMSGPEMLSWAEKADRYARPDTPGRAWANLMLSIAKSMKGLRAEGLSLLKSSLDQARALKDVQLLAYAGADWLILGMTPWDAAETLKVAEELATAKGLGENIWSFYPFGAFIRLGLRQRAEDVANNLRQRAEITGDTFYKMWSLAAEAILAVIDGRLEESLEKADRYLEYGRQGDFSDLAASQVKYFALRPLLYLGRATDGPQSELWKIVHEEMNKPRFRNLTLIPAYLGQRDKANARLEHMLAERPKITTREDLTPASWDIDCLEAAVLVGHRKAADLLLQHFAGNTLATTDYNWTTCIARHLGAAAAMLGRYEESHKHYQEAIRVTTEMRFRPELALTRLQLAELLLEHYPDEKNEAIEHLDFAIKEFREMKMQPSLERALRQKKILKA